MAHIEKGNSMNIVSTSRSLIPALLGAALVASPAVASELREGQAAVTKLSPDASAVTYFVDRPDGLHVIVTVRTGHDAGAGALHQPPAIQFTSRILPGQTIDVSMPAAAGREDSVLEITRRAERVAVESKHLSTLVD
jgi:hypothetical protein